MAQDANADLQPYRAQGEVIVPSATSPSPVRPVRPRFPIRGVFVSIAGVAGGVVGLALFSSIVFCAYVMKQGEGALFAVAFAVFVASRCSSLWSSSWRAIVGGFDALAEYFDALGVFRRKRREYLLERDEYLAARNYARSVASRRQRALDCGGEEP